MIRSRSPTPSSDDYDEIKERRDNKRALQRALKAIQKKRRVAVLHRQIEAKRKALEERAPLPTLTATIRPRSDTSATMVPAPKRSRRNGSDSKDDSRLRVKDPKTYEGKNQGEVDSFTLDCERVFRTRSSQYKKEWRRADCAEGWIKPELAKPWNLKVEWLGDNYCTWSNLKDYLQNDLRPKALTAKAVCSRPPAYPRGYEEATPHARLSARNQISHRTASRYLREPHRPHRASYQYRGAYKGQRSTYPSYAQAASGMRSGGSFKDKGKAKADHKDKEETKSKQREGGYKATPRVEKPTTTADGRPICFNCSEPGHKSKSCPKPKKEREEGKKVSHLMATPSQKGHKKSDGKRLPPSSIQEPTKTSSPTYESLS
ncbi:MAG: hypothetical protein M1816_004400 [Peltula sp. TS41687]|nr:MAG: hypothetical protein M1816_004400 [Peltula sp. TS41687]